jgi:hypothetical protein
MNCSRFFLAAKDTKTHEARGNFQALVVKKRKWPTKPVGQEIIMNDE